jgi:hypothetical protein
MTFSLKGGRTMLRLAGDKVNAVGCGPAAPAGGRSSTPGRIKNTLSPAVQNIAASGTKSRQQSDAFCKTQPTTSTAEFARF